MWNSQMNRAAILICVLSVLHSYAQTHDFSRRRFSRQRKTDPLGQPALSTPARVMNDNGATLTPPIVKHSSFAVAELVPPLSTPQVTACYELASSFCAEQRQGYAEFLSCVVESHHLFPREGEHCGTALAIPWSECVRDLVRVCPHLSARDARNCLVKPDHRHLFSTDCTSTPLFELIEDEWIDDQLKLLSAQDSQRGPTN